EDRRTVPRGPMALLRERQATLLRLLDERGGGLVRVRRIAPERQVPRLADRVEGQQRGERADAHECPHQPVGGVEARGEEGDLPDEAGEGRDAGQVEGRDEV